MIVLHSWGGCRMLLLKGSSFLGQDQRSSQSLVHLRKGHVYLARLSSAGSSIAVPWPRQELSLSFGEIGILSFLKCSMDAPCPPMVGEQMPHPWWH